jgi:hypothetical protein
MSWSDTTYTPFLTPVMIHMKLKSFYFIIYFLVFLIHQCSFDQLILKIIHHHICFYTFNNSCTRVCVFSLFYLLQRALMNYLITLVKSHKTEVFEVIRCYFHIYIKWLFKLCPIPSIVNTAFLRHTTLLPFSCLLLFSSFFLIVFLSIITTDTN